MINEIKTCHYCGSEEIGVGYQLGDGEMSTDFAGSKTSKINHLICLKCGAILKSTVAKPEIFADDNRL